MIFMRVKLLILFLIFSFLLISNIVRAENKVCLYFFYGQGCPHCDQEKQFLRELKITYKELEVKEFEIYYNQSNRELFEDMTKAFNTISSGVPMTFINGKAYIGFAYGDSEIYDPRYKATIGYSEVIKDAIEKCIEIGGCECPTIEITVEEPTEINQSIVTPPVTPLEDQMITVPILGEISLSIPIPLLGMILGFVDGAFNPCALSVVFFLFAYLMSIGSRKKSLIIGVTYALTVFIVYLLFMYGILNVIIFSGYMSTIKLIAGIIIIIAGLIELKDFFFYGKGFSLEIPKFAKSTIEKLIKISTVPSTLLLGIFVSLVEIPCAGVFPFIYITILGGRVISTTLSLVYLLWYNIFFVVPLLVLALVFYFGLVKVEEAEKTRLKTRRYMRLIAGIIMVLFGVWMITG